MQFSWIGKTVSEKCLNIIGKYRHIVQGQGPWGQYFFIAHSPIKCHFTNFPHSNAFVT